MRQPQKPHRESIQAWPVNNFLSCQSIAIDEWFLCDYQLIIDWSIPINIKWPISSIDIMDWLLFQWSISIDWISQDTYFCKLWKITLAITLFWWVLKLVFSLYFSIFADVINVKVPFQQSWNKVRDTDCMICLMPWTDFHGGHVGCSSKGHQHGRSIFTT